MPHKRGYLKSPAPLTKLISYAATDVGHLIEKKITQIRIQHFIQSFRDQPDKRMMLIDQSSGEVKKSVPGPHRF